MFGVIVNAIAVILGSLIGLVCKKGIPEKYSDAIMKGIALCVLYIGFSGALKGENTIIVILAMVLGAVIGTWIGIDELLNKAGSMLEKKFSRDGKTSIAQGFVTASLLFCVGAMTIVGSLTAGLSGDYEMLFTKSVLDFISAIMLTVSLGIGVMFSSVFILVFQGAIALFAGIIAPVLSEAAINEIICSGSLLILGLGPNLLGITKLKVANYIPAMLLIPLLLWLIKLVPFLG